MLWTVLWWTGGVAGGLVALWVLAAAAGLDRPRRWLRGQSGALACGACGHEAVTPDRIATCPECGAEYARAGLLTPRAGLRYGPPLWVVSLLLLALVVIGSALLAPIAGRAANTATIGGPQIILQRQTASYAPGIMGSVPGVTTQGMPDYRLAFHRDLAVTRVPPSPSAGANELACALEVELVVGPGARSGPTSHGTAGLSVYHLHATAGNGLWRIEDAGGAELGRGTGGPAAGVEKLYEAGGIHSTQPAGWTGSADELREAQTIAIGSAESGARL